MRTLVGKDSKDTLCNATTRICHKGKKKKKDKKEKDGAYNAQGVKMLYGQQLQKAKIGVQGREEACAITHSGERERERGRGRERGKVSLSVHRRKHRVYLCVNSKGSTSR